jgi:hypothetical protein
MSAEWLPQGINPARVAVVQYALDKIGYAEMPVGSNSSPAIDKWNRGVGAPPKSPWCASFASAAWGAGHADFASAACEQWHQWGIANGRFRHSLSGVSPGDVVLFALEGAAADHCGICVRSDDGLCLTAEGNTNDNGGREGYLVMLHDRAGSPHAIGYVSLGTQ